MHQETHKLSLFLLATFAATWATYATIVFNGWNPYVMPGMAFLLIGGSAPSWVGLLLVLFTYNKAQRRAYFRRCVAFKSIGLPNWLFILFVFPLIYVLISAAVNSMNKGVIE